MPEVKPFTHSDRRPRNLWLLASVFAVCGMVGIIRAVMYWKNGALYQSLGLEIAPVVLILYGVVWCICGIAGMVLCFLRFPWVPGVIWGSAAVLTLTYWMDRLLLTVNPGRQVNTGFAIAVNLVLLGWTVWVLHRKPARKYFHTAERKQNTE